MVFRTSNAIKNSNRVKDNSALLLRIYRFLAGEVAKEEAAVEEHRKQVALDKKIERVWAEMEREAQAEVPPPPDCYAKFRPDWTRRTPIVIDDVPLPPSTAELFQKEKKV